MKDALLEQYNRICQQIRKENDTYCSQLISVLVDNTEQDDYSWRTHSIAMISLRSRKISLSLSLNTIGNSDALLSITDDYQNLLNDVQRIEGNADINQSVISDALDCILSFSDNTDIISQIEPLVPSCYWISSTDSLSVSKDLYGLLMELADYHLNAGDNELGGHVLSYLVEISRRRNHDAINWHREIVINVLSRMESVCIEESHKICSMERDNFKGIRDDYTADFLWFTACVFQKKGKHELARSVFRNCYRIRHELYGENNWYTAIAKREYCVLSLMLEIDDKDSCIFLLRFISSIAEGGFSEVDSHTLKSIEGKTLYILLLYKLNHNEFSSYEYLAKKYKEICDSLNLIPSEPLIKTRLYYNLLGGFYLKIGNYIQAEKSFKSAINADYPADAEQLITNNQIKTNLLMTYYVENDLDEAAPLLDELLELIDEDQSDLNRKDEYRVLTINNSLLTQAFIELDKEDETIIKGSLKEIVPDIMTGNLLVTNYAPECIVFIITSIQVLIQNDLASKAECVEYITLLEYIKEQGYSILDNGQKIVLLLIMSVLALELGNETAETYIKDAVLLLDRSIIPLSTKAAVLQTAATILQKKGEAKQALVYLNSALAKITEIWHSFMRYCNDSRLLQILAPTQLIFSCCYSIMRKEQHNTWRLYEKVLQYKALASLAGKERNRILYAGNYDISLSERIKNIQNRLSAIEAESIFIGGSEEYESEKEHLRELEAQFASQFSTNVDFVKISIDALKKVLPHNSAVVEFLLCPNPESHSLGDVDDASLILDTFVINNGANGCTITRVSIPSADSLLEEAEEFIKILQDEAADNATLDQIDRKEHLRISIYDHLISPIINLINGLKKVFIAPDSSLVNLPFEILSNSDGELFGDRFNTVIIECARDFLFTNTECNQNHGSLLLGNPQFSVDNTIDLLDDNDIADRTRYAEIKANNIKQLPFSEFELQMVGKYCEERWFSGTSARKSVLQDGVTKSNIHIATHGYYDLSEESDSIYSSCLLLAGVVDWLRTNKQSVNFGNGIVSADEISRMNYHNVELVVLSSCLSAMNDSALSKGFQGIVGGFSASGVKYVISCLWEADDFATTILMDAFYYHYKVKKLAPPAALKTAKQYLRKVTIGDLRSRNWFDFLLKNDDLPLKEKEIIKQYMSKNERFRPFKNEIYWAGFSCFRCN